MEDDFSGSARPVKITAKPVAHQFQLLRSAFMGGRKYPYPLVVRSTFPGLNNDTAHATSP